LILDPEVQMNRQSFSSVVCAVLLTVLVLLTVPAKVVAWTSPDAAAAAQANPELVATLSKEIGGTPEEAAGAAGALFGLAKTRLKADEFSQVEKAVPGMGTFLKAAPSTAAAASPAGALPQLAATVGGIPAVASQFSKMGIKPELVPKAAATLVSIVTNTGGSGVGSLLAGVLK